LRKHVVGEPSYDNFEQKKNDSLLDVHLAITLEILAGILALNAERGAGAAGPGTAFILQISQRSRPDGWASALGWLP
jgi:hypothetical protein